MSLNFINLFLWNFEEQNKNGLKIIYVRCMPILPVRRSISTDNGFEMFEKKLLYDPRPNILPPFFSSSSQIALFVFGSAFGVRLVFWTSRLDGHKSLRLSPLILTAAGTHKHINIYQIQLYYCCWLLACWGVSNSSEIPFSELRWQRRNNRETGVDLQNDFWPSPTQKNKPTEKWQQ